MSLITHCPACGTTFKVVRDQLKISNGWVRCGHCTEVFDAIPSLRELDLSAAALPDPVCKALTLTLDESRSQRPVELDIGLNVLEQLHERPPDSKGEEVGVAEAEAVLPIAFTVAQDALVPPESAFSEPAPDLAPAQDFSFIAKTPAHSHSHKPLMRIGLGISVVLLLLSGALQIVLHSRDRIAAAEPRTQHVLHKICAMWHCQVKPLRRIEAIAVESSSFNKQRGGTYLLSFVLKNTGDVELAMPTIELTLTDLQDAPLVRRVLLPSELMVKSSVLAAGAEWPGTYVVAMTGSSVSGGAEMIKSVAGYRVLAFYP